MDCIFCKIVNKEIPSYCYYEDDKVKVFLDINPNHNGHSLIIPKKHYKDIYDIPDDVLLYINNIAKKIASYLTKQLGCDGISLSQNNGIAQEVKHFHLHVIPKYKIEYAIKIEDIYNTLKKDINTL